MENSQRDIQLDNLKGILIFLVVFGHAIEKLHGSFLPIPGYVYSMIYSFHMPAFVFVSGYLSKSALKTEQYSKKQVKTLLIPFLFMQLIMWLVTSRSLSQLLYPEWTLWYLLSLFVWKMLVVPVSKFRCSILVTVLLSLLVGFSPADRLLSISRTVAFFPYFLIGYKTTSSDLAKLRKWNKVVPAVILVLMFSAAAVLKNKDLPITVYTMTGPYASHRGITEFQGMMLRLMALLIGVMSTYCLLILTPQKKGILSSLGKNTMTVYLGHSVVLLAAALLISRTSPPFLAESFAVLLAALLLSALICLLFGSKWVVNIYTKALDWISSIVLVNDQQKNEQAK